MNKKLALAVAALFAVPVAHAFEIDSGDSDLKMRWDNTFKYSTMYRLKNPDANQVAAYQTSATPPVGSPSGDGDYNFKRGVVSSRMDWLSEFDVTKNNMGGRVSMAAWYDDTYTHGNDNNTGFTHNNAGVGANQFNSATVKAVGHDYRLMDAFGYVKGEIADMPGRITLGRHAVIYGETLMDGSNGIAAAQGPVDIVKAATVPGAQVKEFILPTNQVSGSLQINDKLSVGAYYQFKWEKSPFFAAGSFLSPNDFMGDGAQNMFNTSLGPFGLVGRQSDISPKKSGQWGTQLRYKPESVDVELGFYAANYHAKTPSAAYMNLVQVAPGVFVPNSYALAYQQDIRTVGFSASTVLGSDNVSIETSVRDNMPITGGTAIIQAAPGIMSSFNNTSNPAYAVGKTHHVTLVDIHLFQPNAILKDGGSIAAQYDWHTVSSITKNPTAIDPTTTKSASRLTLAFTADYFQVLDGLDMSIPIVWSHDFGRSRVNVGWVEGGGSLDIGLAFNYLNTWKAGINYHQFIGSHGASIGSGAFNQTQFDRDYVSFNLSRSF